ncbi:L,D-transpeptidase family protein [Lentilitoribacter sp. Alg239-R112]|uniref:L,D-transpeptidase family protein n=1 Tax=Lentilitoribacter sp. Alg239-R112 TaxID=2305987 RepID=UPI0013A6AEA6|nr:L,D-transpeptidase family protein [Lentilitoribacter sp. Alg239-R112]
MTRKFTKNAVILLTAFTIIEVSPLPIVQLVQPAAAENNFLNALFGVNARKRRQAEKKRREEALRQQPKKPAPRIRGARYKTYIADKLVTAKLDQIVDPVTTSAVSHNENIATTAQANSTAKTDPFALGFETLSSLNLKTLPEVSEALVTHYSSSPSYRWVNENGPTKQALALHKALQEAYMVGLPNENYTVDLPNAAVLATGESAWSDYMRFEMELSAAILTYMVDASRGLISPKKISGYHDFKRKKLDLDKALFKAALSDNPTEFLHSFNPSGEHFLALKSELAELLGAEEKERITIAPDTFLKPGKSSPEMRNIVASIRLKGSEELKTNYAFELNTYRGDDLYTPELVTLVKAFQKENNLSDDGIIGRKTIRAMVEDSNAVKIEKVKLAMERARWLPGKLADRRVFINQPAYNVTYYENNKSKLSMRVVVGKKSNQTNFFDDEIEKVEFNPYWGVPQSIITNEMLPKLRADPSYLDRLGYEVSYNGRRSSSSSIDWYSLNSTRAVGVRQPPGRKNALGELKILFPNAHAIYMHDTPAKKLFGRDTRAFSHGCVRLQDPRAMAAAVLGTDLNSIEGHIAPRKNKTVFVDKPIPVHVSYFTAWPNDAGAIEYFDDVYGRDKALQKAFATTIKSRTAS